MIKKVYYLEKSHVRKVSDAAKKQGGRKKGFNESKVVRELIDNTWK